MTKRINENSKMQMAIIKGKVEAAAAGAGSPLMTVIQHAPSAVLFAAPRSRAIRRPPNRRRGGDIRTLLSPASVGATAGFLGTLTPRTRRGRHRTLASVLRGVSLLRHRGHLASPSTETTADWPRSRRSISRSASATASSTTATRRPSSSSPAVRWRRDPELGHVDTEPTPPSG